MLLRVLPILLISTLLFSSCNSEEAEELTGFIIGFLVFLMGTILTGIPAIVFSAISIKTKSPYVPVIAIVLTVVYSVFLFMELRIFSESPTGLTGSVALFPLITVAIIVLCIVFIVMGFKNRKLGYTSNADEKVDVLDNIINSEEDQDLL